MWEIRKERGGYSWISFFTDKISVIDRVTQIFAALNSVRNFFFKFLKLQSKFSLLKIKKL